MDEEKEGRPQEQPAEAVEHSAHGPSDGGVEEIEIDTAKFEMLTRRIREEQNLPVGILAGLVGALVGALGWGLITALTQYQIGFMAIAVGFLVGFAVRKFGKGMDKSFGVAGAALALVGCGLGNLFAVCIAIAQEYSVSVFQVLGTMDAGFVAGAMKVTFSPIDLLFYAIAVYEGYKFSFRRITEDELRKTAVG